MVFLARRERGPAALRNEATPADEGPALATRPPAGRYLRDAYRRAIARGIAKANRRIQETADAAGLEAELLPTWHPGQLRHTFATEVRRRFGLEAAQILLGHSKADVTQVYAERDQGLAVSVMEAIG